MKVTVLGAGAIGSMFGGLIKHARPQDDVVLIARGEHGSVMKQRGGVRLRGPWGEHHVPVTVASDIDQLSGSDFVLFTVKSHASEEAIRAARPFLGNAVVISIQNGINDDVLAAQVSRQRLVMGMTATNMAILEPGVVDLQLGGATVVGPFPDRINDDATRQAETLLRSSGLSICNHPNILGVRYNKVAINALGYASCMSQSNFITEALCDPGWRSAVAQPLLTECRRVFETAGVQLARIPGRPDVNGFNRFLKLLDLPLAGQVAAFGARQIYDRKPIVFSLYQDLLRGKQTEVEYINGEIVRLANLHGVQAPYNAEVVAMVHELEQRGAATFFLRDEVIRRFRNLQLPAPCPA